MWTIASWNVNSLKVRLPQVLQWLASHQPEVLALQETKTQDENFPVQDFTEAGYQVHFAGQKSYNGVAIASRGQCQVLHTALPGLQDPQQRVLCALVDDVCVLNLYVPNGSEVGSDKYAYKLDWLARLHEFTGELLQSYDKLIVLGDFNITSTDEDVHDPAQWRDKIHCSPQEREALSGLLAHGLTDTFRQFEQERHSFSWWDYRAGDFARNRGLRIDLILASSALIHHCADSWIDLQPRQQPRPSDHVPVVAEFRLSRLH
ncbi:MAG: exodeoxyribonuclease III [Gammaproteobacteria bacterium]|nr:exodeoxyribonuclease III [Gammaproteobacteria bacterium]